MRIGRMKTGQCRMPHTARSTSTTDFTPTSSPDGDQSSTANGRSRLELRPRSTPWMVVCCQPASRCLEGEDDRCEEFALTARGS